MYWDINVETSVLQEVRSFGRLTVPQENHALRNIQIPAMLYLQNSLLSLCKTRLTNMFVLKFGNQDSSVLFDFLNTLQVALTGVWSVRINVDESILTNLNSPKQGLWSLREGYSHYNDFKMVDVNNSASLGEKVQRVNIGEYFCETAIIDSNWFVKTDFKKYVHMLLQKEIKL